MTFQMQLGENEVEVTAGDFEYSPEIDISGPQTLYAVYADSGEPYEFADGEEDLAFQRACEIAWNED